MAAERALSRKHQLQNMLVDMCIKRDGPNAPYYIFDNKEVKHLSNGIGFANHNDATHIDTAKGRSPRLVGEGLSIIHLGNHREGGGKRASARHAFVRTDALFHDFETISEEKTHDLRFRPRPLDEINTSESNILSLAYNQGIVNRVLYPTDLRANPSIYMAHRTRMTPNYTVGGVALPFGEVQLEVDMTVEHEGHITVFEAKNWSAKRSDFAVYQLFLPYHLYSRKAEHDARIKSIDCCYLVRKPLNKSQGGGSEIEVRRYTFDDPTDILSIRCLDAQRWRLKRD